MSARHKARRFLPHLFVMPICSHVSAAYATSEQPHPRQRRRLYDAITVSHDNMHPINRLYAISQPIHSSNVIRLITG